MLNIIFASIERLIPEVVQKLLEHFPTIFNSMMEELFDNVKSRSTCRVEKDLTVIQSIGIETGISSFVKENRKLLYTSGNHIPIILVPTPNEFSCQTTVYGEIWTLPSSPLYLSYEENFELSTDIVFLNYVGEYEINLNFYYYYFLYDVKGYGI